jgi:hypothetical protein
VAWYKIVHNDDEEVQYTDFKIDLDTGEGKEVTWGDEF